MSSAWGSLSARQRGAISLPAVRVPEGIDKSDTTGEFNLGATSPAHEFDEAAVDKRILSIPSGSRLNDVRAAFQFIQWAVAIDQKPNDDYIVARAVRILNGK